jgi:hypothetical protein
MNPSTLPPALDIGRVTAIRRAFREPYWLWIHRLCRAPEFLRVPVRALSDLVG